MGKKSKIKNFIDSLPFPYYVLHSIAAVAIMLFGWLLISLDFGFGSAFFWYVSRELTQYEYEGFVDYKGFIYPCVAVIIIYVIAL